MSNGDGGRRVPHQPEVAGCSVGPGCLPAGGQPAALGGAAALPSQAAQGAS